MPSTDSKEQCSGYRWHDSGAGQKEFELAFTPAVKSDTPRAISSPSSQANVHTESGWTLPLKQEGWLDPQSILVTGLSGIDVQVRSLEVPFSSPRKIQAILKSLLHTLLPTFVEVDDLCISWYLQTDKKSPRQRILAAFAKKDSILAYLLLLENIGAHPNLLFPKSAALYPLLQSQLKKAQLAALIDLGRCGFNLCVGDEQKLWLARSVFKTETNAVIREVHQTLSGLQEPVQHIYLVGGGALVPGIETEFKKILNISTQVLKPFSLSPALALAVSYALMGQKASDKINRLNFRQGEFAFRSDLKLELSGPKRTWTVLSLLLFLLLGINYGTRYYVMSAHLERLKERGHSWCERVADLENCLVKIKTTVARGYRAKIPRSAVDTYLDLSAALSPNIPVKLLELEIAPDKIRFSAESSQPEAVEHLSTRLAQTPCFKNVVPGGARQTPFGVQFQLSMDVDCGNPT